MTLPVRFSIAEVFDLPQRTGLIATGKVLTGTIAKGMALRDPETGAETTVLGIEFPTPAQHHTGQITLILQRTTPTPAIAGRVLTSPT